MISSRPVDRAGRLWRTPKWVALTLVVVLASCLFALASSWQYGRAVDQVNAQRAAHSLPSPIAELVPGQTGVPAQSLGRLATVEGRYVHDALVVNRASPDGQAGYWLISAVDDGSGLLTAVLRGWVPQRSTQMYETASAVAITGRVSSDENFYTTVTPDSGQELVAITGERLSQIWQQPIRAGYVVLTEQDPGPGVHPTPVRAAFGEDPNVGFPWQNAGYAFQWLTFIGFVGFVYWRAFRDDLQQARV